MARTWGDKKKIGEKVTNLKQILALPTAPTDLEGYLSIESLLVKNQKGEESVRSSTDTESPEPLLTDNKDQEEKSAGFPKEILFLSCVYDSNESSVSVTAERIEEALDGSNLTAEPSRNFSVALLVIIFVVFIIQKLFWRWSSMRSTRNGSRTKKAETMGNCQEPFKRMSERQNGQEQEASSREGVEDLSICLGQEVRQNLVEQNSFLKTTLAKHEASIQLVFRELRSRDQHLVTCEESQGNAIQDISDQLRAFQKELSKRDELEQKAVSAGEHQDAKMVARSQALQNQLESHQQELRHIQEENQEAQKRLSSQVEQLQRELEDRETAQSSTLNSKQAQMEELTAKLNALEDEICTRDNRVASLEHSVEGRDELQQMKVRHLEEQCSTLGSQVRSLKDQLECYRNQSAKTQLVLKQDATQQLERLEAEFQISQQEFSEVTEHRCSSLEAKVQELAHSLLSAAPTEDLDMVKAQHQECDANLEALQERLQVQEQLSEQYQLLSQGIRRQKELHEREEQERLYKDREIFAHLQAPPSREGQAQKGELRDIKNRDTERETSFLEALSNQNEQWEKLERECFAKHANLDIKIQALEQNIELQKVEQRQQSEDMEEKHSQNAVKMQQAINELKSRFENDTQSMKEEHSSTIAELKSQLLAHTDAMEKETISNLSKIQSLATEITSCREQLCHLETQCCQTGLGLSAIQSELKMQGTDIQEAKKRAVGLSSTVQALASELSHRSKQLNILLEGQSDSEMRLFSELERLKEELRDQKSLQENIQSHCSGLSLTVKCIEDRTESQERQFAQYEENNQSENVERDLKLDTLGEKVQRKEYMLQRNASQIVLRFATLENLVQDLQGEITTQRGEIELTRDTFEANERELALQMESLGNVIAEQKVPRLEQMDEAGEKDTRSVAKQILFRVEDYLDRNSGSVSVRSTSDISVQDHAEEPVVVKTSKPLLSSLSANGQEAEVSTADIELPHESIGAIQELKKSLADKEKEFVCVATRLAAFKAELIRRSNSVTNFETFAKNKRDARCSKVNFLRNEIELQRELLKKWEHTTEKNRFDRNEMRCQLEFLQAQEEHARRELQASIKKKTDLETSLKDEGISDSLAECLRNNYRFQEKQCDEWTSKALEAERLLNSCGKKCSNVAARLELFIDDLGRREDRVYSLEQNLKEALELGMSEDGDFESRLSQLRDDRDMWKEKSDEICHLLRKTEEDYTGLHHRLQEHQEDQLIGIQSVPYIRTSNNQRIESHSPLHSSAKLSAVQQVSMDSVEHLPTRSQTSYESLFFAMIESLKCQLEGRQELEERQEMTFAKTREALETQLEDSKEQCQQLAETMTRVTDDMNSREFLGEKIESLQSELQNRENQLSRLEEEQSNLKKDFDSQIELIRREIGAQEELQRVVQENEHGRSGRRDGLSVLSAKLESLATRFVDRGDLVAKAGALSDGLRKCEDQLASFEQEQDDTKKDISAMIDFVRGDLQVQKQLLQEHLNGVTGEDFSVLLEEVKKLTQNSVTHNSQIAGIEKALKTNEEFCVKLETEMREKYPQDRLQSEQVLQELNDKYIELATKLELLTNEFKARGEQSEGLEKKARDRETLYLTQMDSIRGELKGRQLQQIQVRICDVMMQVASVLAKQKACPVTPNASEQALVTQAFRRQSALMITRAGGDKGTKQVENVKNSAEKRYALTADSNFAMGARPGYSMVSGIMMKNQFVPAMLGAFASVRGTSHSIDN